MLFYKHLKFNIYYPFEVGTLVPILLPICRPVLLKVLVYKRLGTSTRIKSTCCFLCQENDGTKCQLH